MTSALVSDLAAFLLRERNADGGWGYYAGKATRLEPTSWALLALKGTIPDAQLGPVIQRWPVRDGLLGERPGSDANYAFHALALLVLHAFGIEHAQSNAALIRALQGVKGFRIDAPNTSNRQNNRLQGWSWIPATFSWVEPTAWALLALKKFRGSAAAGAEVESARLAEAETLLLDRSCVLGGWNYGNSNMFGAELHPYVSTTAVALLALQDRSGEPPLQRSRDFLSAQSTWERSSYSMSLARIALNVTGTGDDSLEEPLARQVSTTCEMGNHLGAAQALYALRKYDDHAAFRL